ncbi:MAG: hypothetical protein ABIJ47_10650 [Candidatus Bathyarchaeota archaeon]
MPALIHVAVVYGTVTGLTALGFRLIHEATGYMNLGFTVNLGVSMGAGFLVSQLLGVDPMVTLPVVSILTGAFNALTYHLVYRRLEAKGTSEALISLTGLTFLFTSVSVLTVAEYFLSRRVDSPLWCGPTASKFTVGTHFHYVDGSVAGLRWSLIASSLAVILLTVGVYVTMKRSRAACIMSAVSENPSLAQISGIDTGMVRLVSWFLAGGVAGLGGVLLPYMFKGEMGRDCELFFAPVLASAVLAEGLSLWVALPLGVFVGALEILLITLSTTVLGVWVGEYRSLFPAAFLVAALAYKSKTRKDISSCN